MSNAEWIVVVADKLVDEDRQLVPMTDVNVYDSALSSRKGAEAYLADCRLLWPEARLVEAACWQLEYERAAALVDGLTHAERMA